MDLAKEGGRFAAREVIGATLKPWSLGRTLAEMREVFDAPRRVLGAVPDLHRAGGARTPAARPANPMFEEVEQPGIGTYLMPGSPLELLGRGAARGRAARRVLGEHTDEVLAEVLGLADAEIGKLYERGVVAGPNAPAPA